MILEDKNRTLQPPEGYDLNSFSSSGAYLKAAYTQPFYNTDAVHPAGQNVVVVYLNDMGREVARIKFSEWFPVKEKTKPRPVSRWVRFKFGFFITIDGIQEMIRCLRNW